MSSSWEEYADFIEFIANKSRNVKNPFAIPELCDEFKKANRADFHSKTRLLRKVKKIRLEIHKREEFLLDTKVKMLFALGAPIDFSFLEELEYIADVELDEHRRITKYEEKGGRENGLKLNGTHSSQPPKLYPITAKRMLDFLSKKLESATSPLNDIDFVREFQTSTDDSGDESFLIACYKYLKRHIYITTEFDIETRVKLIFFSGAKVDTYFLDMIRKDAHVETDEFGRITKYESKNGSLMLKGDHPVTKSGIKNNSKDSDDSEEEDDDVKNKENAVITRSGRVSKPRIPADFFYGSIDEDDDEDDELVEFTSSDQNKKSKNVEILHISSDENDEEDEISQDFSLNFFPPSLLNTPSIPRGKVSKNSSENNHDDDVANENSSSHDDDVEIDDAATEKSENLKISASSSSTTSRNDDVALDNSSNGISSFTSRIDNNIVKTLETSNSENSENSEKSAPKTSKTSESPEISMNESADKVTKSNDLTLKIEKIPASSRAQNGASVITSTPEVPIQSAESCFSEAKNQKKIVKNSGVSHVASESDDDVDLENSTPNEKNGASTGSNIAKNSETLTVLENGDGAATVKPVDLTLKIDKVPVEKPEIPANSTKSSVKNPESLDVEIQKDSSKIDNPDDEIGSTKTKTNIVKTSESSEISKNDDEKSTKSDAPDSKIDKIPARSATESPKIDNPEIDNDVIVSIDNNKSDLIKESAVRNVQKVINMKRKLLEASKSSIAKIAKNQEETSIFDEENPHFLRNDDDVEFEAPASMPTSSSNDDVKSGIVIVKTTRKVGRPRKILPESSTTKIPKNQKSPEKSIFDSRNSVNSTPRISLSTSSKNENDVEFDASEVVASGTGSSSRVTKKPPKPKINSKTTRKTGNMKRKLAETSSDSAAKIPKTRNDDVAIDNLSIGPEEDLIYDGGDDPPIPYQLPNKTEASEEDKPNFGIVPEFGNSQFLEDYPRDDVVRQEEMNDLEAIRDASFAPDNSSILGILDEENIRIESVPEPTEAPSSKEILKFLRNLLRTLESPMLEELQKKIDEAIGKIGDQNNMAPFDEILTAMGTGLFIVNRSACSSTTSTSSSTKTSEISLKGFLWTLRSTLVSTSAFDNLKAFDDFQKKIKLIIDELGIQDKIIPIERIRLVMETILVLATF